MLRTDAFEKTLMLGKMRVGGEGDDRGWADWMASLTQWTWVSKLHQIVMDREALRVAMCGFTKSQTWLSNWTELKLNALLELIPPHQSTRVFLFLLSPNAILWHFLNLLLITYCTTFDDLVKEVITVGHSFATHYLQDSWHVRCVCLQCTHECFLVWHYHVGFTLKSLRKVDYLTGPRS